MHLLAVQPGSIDDGSEAVDLGQTPGEIVILSSADSELACLARARAGLPADFPAVRLANLLHLKHNLSVDLYVEQVVAQARFVCVRLLGGRGYWPYGIDEIADACRSRGIPLALLPGDGRADGDFTALSTLAPAVLARLRAYSDHGGTANARALLCYAADLIGRQGSWPAWVEPAPLLPAGLYWPGQEHPDLAAIRARWPDPAAPVAPVLFYRALVLSGGTAAIDGMVEALAAEGLNPLPVFVQSLKDGFTAELLARLFAAHPPAVIVNATGFATAVPGGAEEAVPPGGADCPVLQVVLAASNRAAWAEGSRGLAARDMAMNVALPEVDGRIFTRAIAFKAEERFDPATQCPIVGHAPEPDRLAFVAALAAGWARLRRVPAAERRIALVLANYPNRDGRLGNGVGLDTPASAVAVLAAMRAAGYDVAEIPADGDALMRDLSAGPTNAAGSGARGGGEFLPMPAYAAFFARLPGEVRAAVTARWGSAEADPFAGSRDGRAGFILPVLRLGRVAVAIQPARGYNIDPAGSYHDPALVPPHGYLAFHAWLREAFAAHAVVHLGKHGNLEWLPGKALALSASCYPEAALGPLPNLYPFIVNDPGEGSQAKRRAAAVILDHLTPPLTRAESYGSLKDLEALVDEYYDAAQGDPRRVALLRDEILALAAAIGLDRDLEAAAGPGAGSDADSALARLDAYLCELKELQIRDGLHVFGRSPQGRLRTDLLVALTRLPRGSGRGGQASLHRALAADFGFDGWDPLDADPAAPWTAARPAVLAALLPDAWRSAGDTVERLELLAAALVAGEMAADPAWRATAAVLAELRQVLAPAVAACGPAELAGLLRGLDGRFVTPGPSGAPTRGRPEVLPTGRNFYSVDTRAVPTPAAWSLGWASAQLLVEDYMQRHGDWPRRMALTAWGTANMRTGGDDIAQALALMGVRPCWDGAARRVTGFEVLPLSALDRPRVDVTFRVSGFFRDAFPAQIDLVDSAARAVIALDEPEAENPLAAAAARQADALRAAGVPAAEAELRAGYRVFGSKPGAYGAGLQALMDEGGWQDRGDLAEAYLGWGGYAYGSGREGQAERDMFQSRLAGVEAVVQNQDNREHDLLDSDDYYQFEGGMAAAVTHLRGAAPQIYHNDHSRPERPRVRTLEDELARIVRGRAANPKWIAGVMRHGYKGGFEIAATLDYLFAFAATTGLVKDHQFDMLFEAWLGDPQVRTFLADSNPAALREMADRFREAIARGLWRPRSNSAADMLAGLAGAQPGGTS